MKLIFAGDFIPTQNVYINPTLREKIEEPDFGFINLETPLTISDNAIKKTGNNFKVKPDLISKVQELGFNGVTLANNHIRDFGNQGVIDTINACEKNNIIHMGAGININKAKQPFRLDKNGLKVSVINVAEKEYNIAEKKRAGANPYNTVDIYYQIQEEKKKSDKIIVVYHGGVEYIKYPAPYIVKEFKFIIDAGADAVVSHHTHRYSGIIEYNNKPIAFGLGNFFSIPKVKNTSTDWYKGLCIKLSLSKSKVQAELIPIEFDVNTQQIIEPMKDDIISDVREISKGIQNWEMLEQVWEDLVYKDRNKMKSVIKSSSKISYKIKKNLPQDFNKLSLFRILTMLNILRCESHLQKFIKLLELEYNIKSK